MNKQVAIELDKKAQEVAQMYSNFNREGNFNNETFEVAEVIPMTDMTATVILLKNTGKKAALFFFYIARGKSKGWKYFVPTDAHILGMTAFNHYKLEVERSNYKHNFNYATTETES